jgi:hypothetical protein
VSISAYQTSYPGSTTAFVSKVNPAGNGPVYSTFLGGQQVTANAIAVDSVGSAYVTGQTFSPTFPVTSGAYQENLAGTQNAFVAKLNATGSALAYSTYLGGSSYDAGLAIAVDGAGNAYVAGTASSGNFPTTSGAPVMEMSVPSYYSTAFVTSLNASGTALQYSTYIGASTYPNAIALQPGYAVVAGSTSSTSLPGASLGFQKTLPAGAQNAFVAKLKDTPVGCSYSVSPTAFSFGNNGGAGNVSCARVADAAG